MALFLIHWLVVALGLAAAAYLVPGVTISSGSALAFGALALGFVNAVIRPVMALLTLPLTIITLGLFYFVVNALMLMLTSWLADQIDVAFHVDGFWTAVVGGVIIAIVSWGVKMILPQTDQW